MYCANFAQSMLERSGEFYPFGAHIDADGKMTAVGGHDGKEHPLPQDLYQFLASALTTGARNGEILVAALAANVNVPAEVSAPWPDAIRVHIEADGYARFLYIPYRLIEKKGLFRKKTVAELSKPVSVETGPVFFGS